jgi:DMSO/TMAO reductase YedYZ molybdopterin-dependent catalytic subunit
MSKLEASESLTPEELRLATRNHGMPLEALAYDITPIGLHYLLIHYDIPVIDPESWLLAVDGAVERELELSLDDVRSRPKVTEAVTMECAGNGRARLSPRPVSQPWLNEAVGTAEWTGTPLRPLLEEAGIADGAVEVLFTARDRGVEGGLDQRYARSLPLEEALRDEVLLVYGMGDAPLLPQHGFPLRLVVPGWYGMTNVKWLERITVLDQAFEGYQNTWSYNLRQTPEDAGERVTRMEPRALMIPPGIPVFATRERQAEPGSHTITGRAWSGYGQIERVEVSDDGGASWHNAELGPQASRWGWRSWHWEWSPSGPRDYELCCRATDSTGRSQPVAPPWNLHGFANNEVQRVPVAVTG